MRLKFQRNIPLLYLYSFLLKRVITPIIIIYFLFNNLNYTQIGILAAITSIVWFATEVHGGIFADIHGKKYSLMLHSIFGMLTMFFYYIGNSFSLFIVASIMYGLAGAFISGTRNALLYDTLSQLDRTSDFKKHNGRMLLFSHTFNAIVLLFIPVIYTYNTKLPFLIGIGFFLASLVTSLFFIEPPLTRKSKKTLSAYNIKLFESIKEIWANKKLIQILILTTITAAFVFVGSKFIQPLLQITGRPIIYFGIVYFFMRIIKGIGAEINHRIEKRFGTRALLFIGIVSLILGLTGFAFGTVYVVIGIAAVLITFAEGFNRMTFEDELNKNIKSENRTTILSISSLSNELFFAVLVFTFGIVADITGVQKMFIYVILAFIVCIAITFAFIKRSKRKHPQTL
ncbi:MFS transporter [Candidatus Woesearchaeota archaeon]|nr:MFS transporter [Candidatus Woesearchaeota archaeon]